eukprot:15365984-Ditylum_brightwellii.AAC.1
MDPFLEPGILSVEHQDSAVNYDPAQPLQLLLYVLIVDEHLYWCVLREAAQLESTPCGLYFCCHDDAAMLSVQLMLYFASKLDNDHHHWKLSTLQL